MKSKLAQAAIRKHGESACLKAFHMNKMGECANTIAKTCPFDTIRTTRQADAAINAGREIYEAEHGYTRMKDKYADMCYLAKGKNNE